MIPHYNKLSIPLLIHAALQGNEKAFESIYKGLVEKMRWLCIKHTYTIEDAEDCLQEGFLKLYRKLGTYRGEGSFEGWCSQVFINICKNYTRTATRKLKPVTIETETMQVADKEMDAFGKLFVKDLYVYIDQLPKQRRKVFTLHVHGYSLDEITEMLCIKKNTSKSILYRARIMLQKQIQATG